MAFLSTGFLVLAGILTVGAAFVAVYELFLPEYYASTVRLAVEEPSSPNATHGSSEGSRRISTAPEVIQSEAVLYPVVTNLLLNATWANRYNEKEPLRLDLTKVTRVRNTSLLQITVRSEDKHEAATIANRIADSYRVVKRQRGQSSERPSFAVEIVDLAEPGLRPQGRVAGSFFISGSLIIFIESAGAIVLALLLTRLFVPAQRGT